MHIHPLNFHLDPMFFIFIFFYYLNFHIVPNSHLCHLPSKIPLNFSRDMHDFLSLSLSLSRSLGDGVSMGLGLEVHCKQTHT